MPPQDRPSHSKHGATWGQGKDQNQPKGEEDLVATCLPGQSNADNTTTKLGTHTLTTKVIINQLC